MICWKTSQGEGVMVNRKVVRYYFEYRIGDVWTPDYSTFDTNKGYLLGQRKGFLKAIFLDKKRKINKFRLIKRIVIVKDLIEKGDA